MSKATVEIEDAPTIFFDFAQSYYDGMGDPMYRVGCGTMYVSDISYVADMIDEAYNNYNDDHDDESWYYTILSCMDEILYLKSKYDWEVEE